jgi:hypothetical protein
MNEELAEYLRYMMQLEGWKYVEKAMTDKIQYHIDQLLSCPLEKVEYHRNMIEAMRWLPATIDEAMEKPN